MNGSESDQRSRNSGFRSSATKALSVQVDVWTAKPVPDTLTYVSQLKFLIQAEVADYNQNYTNLNVKYTVKYCISQIPKSFIILRP